MRIVANTLEHDERLTVREIRDMVSSRAFVAFGQKLSKMLEEERNSCEKAEDPDKWRKAQGAAAILRVIQQLPQTMERELEREKSK